MKILIFNDSQSIEAQAVYKEGDRVIIRIIHMSPDELKTFFKDEFMTRKMTLKETHKEDIVYENYTVFSYIKEDAGGIFEVEMIQAGKDTGTRLTEVEEIAKLADKKATENKTEMQMAIAEMTMLIAASIPAEGGVENV